MGNHPWHPDHRGERAGAGAFPFADLLPGGNPPPPQAGKTYTIHLAGCCNSAENQNFSDYAPVSLIVSGIVPQVPDLKITQVEKVDPAGIYSLGWQSNPGEIYRIETSTDLINWSTAKDENVVDLPDVLPQGMLSTIEVHAGSTAEERRFWRVRALQPWEGAP